MLVDMIMASLNTVFTGFENEIYLAGVRVSETPQAWQGGTVWNMISDVAFTASSVIMVIAGLILGFFIALELVQMLVEKNNLADIDMVAVVLKWVVKSAIAIMIVSNVDVVVGAIFQLGQEAITGTASGIIGSVNLTGAGFLSDIEAQISTLSIGRLIGLLLQVQILRIIGPILGVAIMIVVLGRMTEIMMYLVVAPIPLATMANQEYRSMGNNYLKNLLAVAFQGLLIVVVLGIMAVLIQNWIMGVGAAPSPDVDGAEMSLWGVFGYMFLSIFALFKTSSISKAIFGAS